MTEKKLIFAHTDLYVHVHKCQCIYNIAICNGIYVHIYIHIHAQHISTQQSNQTLDKQDMILYLVFFKFTVSALYWTQ